MTACRFSDDSTYAYSRIALWQAVEGTCPFPPTPNLGVQLQVRRCRCTRARTFSCLTDSARGQGRQGLPIPGERLRRDVDGLPPREVHSGGSWLHTA